MASRRPQRNQKRQHREGRGLDMRLLLPVTIVVAAAMMFVRVNDVWKGLSSPSSPLLSFNQSQAQQPPPPGGRKPGQPSPTMPDRSATGGGAATAPPPAPSAPNPSPASPAAPVTGGEAAPPAGGEPPTFTQNEIDVLQKLSERRESLDARQHDLDLRENMIKAAEARIDKKIAEMKSLQASVEGILKQVDDQDDAKLKSLVKIYETMKPKDAARIFEGLDMPVLLGVISRMKEQKVAPVMEAMSADKAKAITDALAARRSAKAEGKGG